MKVIIQKDDITVIGAYLDSAIFAYNCCMQAL